MVWLDDIITDEELDQMDQIQKPEEPIDNQSSNGCLLVIAITVIRVVINNIIRSNHILITVKCLQNGSSVEVIDLNIAFNFAPTFPY